MKRLLTAIAAFMLLVSGVANATDREDIDAKAQEKLEQAIAELELTDEQVEAIRPILEGSFERRAAVLDEYGIELGGREKGARLGLRERRALRSDLKDEHKETIEALSEVLTDDQLAAYEAMAEERRDKLKLRMRNRRN